jgi:hypothetical protein
MGVSFMKVGDDEQVVAVARSRAAALAALESVEIPDNVADQEDALEVDAAADTMTQGEEV